MEKFSHIGATTVAVNRQGLELPSKRLMPSGKREGLNLNARCEYNTLSNICIVEPYAA